MRVSSKKRRMAEQDLHSPERLVERLLRRCVVVDDRSYMGSPCIEWCGQVLTSGYGGLHFGSMRTTVHRIVYAILVGPIPEKYHVNHLCLNKLCVHPAHLNVLTCSDNHKHGNPHRGCTRGKCPHDNPPLWSGRGGCAICGLARKKKQLEEAKERQRVYLIPRLESGAHTPDPGLFYALNQHSAAERQSVGAMRPQTAADCKHAVA